MPPGIAIWCISLFKALNMIARNFCALLLVIADSVSKNSHGMIKLIIASWHL